MFRGARLAGFPTLKQLYSLTGALESASASEPPAPACGRGARGGRMWRAGGAREDNDVCLFVILPEGWNHPQISLSVVTFLRAGNRKQ